jgi:Arc/MetJ-type ribon-helix-helix transcriptional regulator
MINQRVTNISLDVHLIFIGGFMNINLGAPYERILSGLIEKGYAGNQTEVIRQALVAYDRQVKEEEAFLVHKGVEIEMAEIKSGKVKTIPMAKVMKEAGL